MRFAAVAILLCYWSGLVSSRSCSLLDKGTCYGGGAYSGGPGAGLEECREKCRADAKCYKFTYNTPDQTCYQQQKTTATYNCADNGNESGDCNDKDACTLLGQGTCYYGHGFEEVVQNVASSEACCDKCRENPTTCAKWAYHNNACFLIQASVTKLHKPADGKCVSGNVNTQLQSESSLLEEGTCYNGDGNQETIDAVTSPAVCADLCHKKPTTCGKFTFHNDRCWLIAAAVTKTHKPGDGTCIGGDVNKLTDDYCTATNHPEDYPDGEFVYTVDGGVAVGDHLSVTFKANSGRTSINLKGNDKKGEVVSLNKLHVILNFDEKKLYANEAKDGTWATQSPSVPFQFAKDQIYTLTLVFADKATKIFIDCELVQIYEHKLDIALSEVTHLLFTGGYKVQDIGLAATFRELNNNNFNFNNNNFNNFNN